jgi:Tol biopolymer transport system component
MRVAATAVVVVLAVLGAAASAHAAFSGHNGRIVFQSNRTGNADIYTMNPDGSNRVQLTTTPSEDVDPRWSPDGMRIAFASDRTGIFQIYTMNADGTDVRQLTTLLGHNRRPSWTADGRILFHSDVDDPAQARDIFVMNADGSGVTNLTNTPGGDDAYATASPRGSKIVFSSVSAGTGSFC